MKYLLFIMLLISSTAFAETYTKVDSDTIKITDTVELVVDITSIKSNRQSLQTSCDEQLAEYDRQISEAQMVGVE